MFHIKRHLNLTLTRNVIVVGIGISLLVAAVRLRPNLQWHIDEIEATIESLISVVREPAGKATYNVDAALAASAVQGLAASRFVGSVKVVDDFGTVLVDIGEWERTEPPFWLRILDLSWQREHRVGLVAHGRQVGHLVVGTNDRMIVQNLRTLVATDAVNSFFIFAMLAVALMLVFHHTLTRPLLQLARAVAGLGPDRVDWKPVPAPPGHEQDEIGALAASFDAMSHRLGRSMDELTAENRERTRTAELLGRANEELTRARNFVHGIVNAMPSMLIGVDGAGRVTLWNSEAERVTGLSARQATGSFLQEVFPRLAVEEPAIRKAIEGREPVRREKMRWPEGHCVTYYDMTVYPLTSQGEEGAVIRLDDVSARVQMEERMVQTEKMMSVGGLAAGMAHEINNPLGAIMQGSQLIERRFSEKIEANAQAARELGLDLDVLNAYMERRGIRGYLQGIHEAGVRAAAIVRNMLDFSRKSQAGFVACDINGLLDKSVELVSSDYDLKRRYDFRRIEVRREFDAHLPPVPVTATEMEQVFLNILKNAAEAMADKADGGEEPCIVLRTAHEDGHVHIEISDNGPGMDDEVRKRVLEPFFTTKPPGLGLSVSYFIVTENHDGTFHVLSEPGRGTTFVITLPLEHDCA